ncbi:MAG: PD-(D/E)XK nuclease family protein [Microvirga sp.]
MSEPTLPQPPGNPRGPRAFIWVTWVTGLLAGTKRCEWAAWYRAHYKDYPKVAAQNAGMLTTWRRQHAKMVNARAELMERDGWAVTLEGDNAFKLEGRAATLSGKPDLIATREQIARVIDQKTGEAKEEHGWQVRLYMWALSKIGNFKRIDGEVQYTDHSEEILADDFPPADVAKIPAVLQVVGGEIAPPRTPTIDECVFCDIAGCPDRLQQKVVNARELF